VKTAENVTCMVGHRDFHLADLKSLSQTCYFEKYFIYLFLVSHMQQYFHYTHSIRIATWTKHQDKSRDS
jgi:hypothetical protein